MKDRDGLPAARERIMKAAFEAWQERGYGGASTAEIAARAKVSKRDIYVHFKKKEDILAACVSERTRQMRTPLELPPAGSRAALAAALTVFGAVALREVTRPTTTAVYRLAIQEAERAPELARALDVSGRQALRGALAGWLKGAKARGLLKGEPDAMAAQFLSLLFGNIHVLLLLRVAEIPTEAEARRRAAAAADALLKLH